MLYLQKKYSLLTLLISLFIRMLIKTKSVLIVILWCAVVSLLPAQEIERSQQIAISPYRGFVGVVITAKCSSESLGPGIDLSLQWLVKEGESNTTTALGGCEADNPGFQRMSCSASPALTGNALTDISVIEPYEQEPDYAVSTINYRTTATPTTMVCVLGNGDSEKTLEMTPDIAIEASIENLHMLCENGMSTLNWELKGSADHSQVNFNDGAGWRNTTLTSWPYTVTRADHRRSIDVRGVSDLYGLTPAATIRLALTDSAIQVMPRSCSSMIFNLVNENDLKPATYRIFMDSLKVEELNLYDSLQLIVNIPEELRVPTYNTKNLNVDQGAPVVKSLHYEIITTWGCYQPTRTDIENLFFWSEISDGFANRVALGPEQLTLGCLINEEGNRVSLPLNWVHRLPQEAQDLEWRGENSTYHIVVTYKGNSTTDVSAIDFGDHPPDDSNRLNTLPQSVTIPLQKGNTYQVSITPDYPVSNLLESFCPAQTLTRNITIPANTPVKQLNETSVELQSMGRSSGFYVALFNQQNETAIAEYDDQNGNENLLMTDLALDQNYTAEIVYNGTDTIPCRSETIQFFLTAVPSPSYSELIAETTDTSMVFTSIAIPLSTSLDSAATSSMMSTPTPTPFPTSIPTAFEESTDPIQPASKDSPISLYIAGAIWSGVIVFAGILITINVCTSAKKK